MMRESRIGAFFGILLFGSLWGALEATLGGLLANVPNHGAIMGNIGIVILAAAVALYKRPSVSLAIGLVAASFKLLDVPLFGVAPFAKMIVSPMTAIVVESLAFATVVALAQRWYKRSTWARGALGAAAMYLNYALEALVFVYILHKGPPILISGHAGRFLLTDGSIAALLALLASPVGYAVGSRVKRALKQLAERKPRLAYSGATAGILICLVCAVWGTIAIG